jgi:hypothetical protein
MNEASSLRLQAVKKEQERKKVDKTKSKFDVNFGSDDRKLSLNVQIRTALNWKDTDGTIAKGCTHSLQFNLDEVVTNWDLYTKKTINKIVYWNKYCEEKEVVINTKEFLCFMKQLPITKGKKERFSWIIPENDWTTVGDLFSGNFKSGDTVFVYVPVKPAAYLTRQPELDLETDNEDDSDESELVLESKVPTPIKKEKILQRKSLPTDKILQLTVSSSDESGSTHENSKKRARKASPKENIDFTRPSLRKKRTATQKAVQSRLDKSANGDNTEYADIDKLGCGDEDA